MPVHNPCPSNEILLGAGLVAGRCNMIVENRCKGNGKTVGSLWPYCEGCSVYYGLCEMCGKPFTREYPKDMSPQ